MDVRRKHQSVASRKPFGDQTHNLHMYPDSKANGAMDNTLPTEIHWMGLSLLFFK